MKKTLILLAAAGAVLASCSKVDAPAESQEVTFTAYSESQTKTVLDGTKVLWGAGDEISLLAGDTNAKFTSTNTSPAPYAEFKGTLAYAFGSTEGSTAGASLFAVSPYDAAASLNGSYVTTTVAAVQTAVAGTFDPKAFVTIAKSEGFNLQFYNLVGGVRFKLSTPGIKTITIMGNNREALAGRVKVAIAEDGKPSVAEVLNPQIVVTLNAPTGGTFETDTYYYVTLLPVALEKGFTATFSTGATKGTRTSSTAATIARSMFGDLGVADTGVTFESAAETKDVWVPGYAQSAIALYGTDNEPKSCDVDWLTYKGGAVYAAINTTGKPRRGTIELNSGSKATVTQISPRDFNGKYTYNTKIFSKNSFIAAANAGAVNVTFGSPILGETLDDVETGKKHSNVIGISGLYYSAIMDAAIDINYQAKTAKLGLFCDARDNAQAVENGVAGYNYVAFLPGLATKNTTGWGATYNFLKADLGTEAAPQDYCWIWFDLDPETLDTFKWNSFGDGRQYISRLSGPNTLIGISVVPTKSKEVNAETVYSNWDVVYQANYNNKADTYTSFVRVAE